MRTVRPRVGILCGQHEAEPLPNASRQIRRPWQKVTRMELGSFLVNGMAWVMQSSGTTHADETD